MNTAPTAQYVTDVAVAAHLGLHVCTVRKDRSQARRIPFIKLGGRILYRLHEVDAALDLLAVGGVAPKPRKATP